MNVGLEKRTVMGRLDAGALSDVLGAALAGAAEPVAVVADPGATALLHPVVYANDAFFNLLGVPRSAALGSPIERLATYGGRQNPALAAVLANRKAGSVEFDVAGGAIAVLDMRPIEAAGEKYWYATARTGAAARLAADREAARGRTDLVVLEDRLRQTLAQCRRGDLKMALMVVGLDGYDALIDAHGPDGADSVRTGAGVRLHVTFRESDTVMWLSDARYVLMLPIAREQDTARLAQKVRDTIAPPFSIGRARVAVTASIGVAVFPDDADAAEPLMRIAGEALNTTRAAGGDGFHVVSDGLDHPIRERIRNDLRTRWAIDQDQFRVCYQPMIDPRDDALFGMEALLRWHHPEIGLVPSAELLKVAEESGLIVAIGEWMLRGACAQNKAWQDAGLAPVPVTVNLSPLEFRRPGLVRVVAGVLKETGLAAEHLCLDLSVRVLRTEPEWAAMVGKLEELKEIGVLLAIDNYGTSDLPLDQLRRLPLDRLIIDSGFMLDGVEAADRARVADAAVTLARGLGLRIVAQGVDSVAAKDLLSARDIDAVQGELIGEPMPAARFTERFAAPGG